jgi:hypothetical protein
MDAQFFEPGSIPNLISRENINARMWVIWFAFLVIITLVFGVMMISQPTPSAIAWLALLICVAAVCYEPRYGIYILLLFTLFSDQLLIGWFPFVKNFSSLESLLFLNKSIIVSPLEFFLVFTLAMWLFRSAIRRKLDLYQGPLFYAALIFTFFIIIGLVYGLGTRGNVNIGLWEARPIFYMPVMLVLTSNLIETRSQANNVMWVAMVAIGLLGVYGFFDFIFIKQGEISRIESNIEHSAAVRMNTLYVMAILAWMFRASRAKRWIIPLFVPMTFVTYIVAQRRASFIGLAIALGLIGVALFRENRKLFWKIAPPLAIIAVLYLGAFWNNQSALGLPARAIKSTLFSGSSNAQEDSSNDYRVIENINTNFTIHNTSPFTGVGFGKKFYIVAPLPDISFFAWWEYITHNSIMWIWMKSGATGFFSMIFLVGLSLVVGVRTVWRMPVGDMNAIALTALIYIFMHFVYAYVDMSWDNQSMIYIGTMMGLLNSLERIVAKPVSLIPKRWQWSPEPQLAPQIRDL